MLVVLGSLMDTSTPKITEIITSFTYSSLSRKVLTGVVCVSAQAWGFLKDLYNSQSSQDDIFVVWQAVRHPKFYMNDWDLEWIITTMITLNYPRFQLIYFAGPNSDRRTTDFGTKFKKLLYVLCFLGIVDVWTLPEVFWRWWYQDKDSVAGLLNVRDSNYFELWYQLAKADIFPSSTQTSQLETVMRPWVTRSSVSPNQ